jgi:phospholipid/cholesterol/gamma-HCH transport system substrate-binding protein
MSSKKTDIQVGIAVIISLVILVMGIMWIGEVRLNRKWQSYTVYFDEVGGLSPGDPVMVSGLELGKVNLISLEDGRVRTDLLIDEEVVLREGCSIEIRSIGLMGEKYLYILPGDSGQVVAPGTVIEGDYKAGLPEVVADMGDIMAEMKSAAAGISKLVSAQASENTLGESLEKLNAATDEIRSLIKDNKADIRSTVKSMKSASADLNTLVGDRKGQIADGIDRFSRASARLDSLTVTLKGIADGVEQGQGTLGMLVKEKKLHEEMEATLDNLNRLIKDIKEHPERYITIKIF